MKTRYFIRANSARHGILPTELGSFRTKFWASLWCDYHNFFNGYSHRWEFVVVKESYE